MTVAAILFCAGSVYAFHRGGVGECEGCHTIHNSANGFSAGISSKFLLRGSSPSSVCLNCHQKSGDTGPTSYHISTAEVDMPFSIPPRQLSPGGDFGWLKKSYAWIPALGGAIETSAGDSHGHNIDAPDYGYFPDSYKASSPGGSYPSLSLGCTSCHDPHGKYRRNPDGAIRTTGFPIKDSGSFVNSPEPDTAFAVGAYRLLAGSGYTPKSLTAGLSFANNPPFAVAPFPANRSESISQTRVAYGDGMSEWCRNCHATIHSVATPTPLIHPAGSSTGRLPSEITSYYDSYVKTGDLSGTNDTSYLSLVPFEVGSTSYASLKMIVSATPNKGPSPFDGTPQVMCLSCHRAHASGWDGSMRWNNKTAAIVHEGKYSQEGQPYQPYGQGRSEAEALRAYYDIPAARFATEQTPLCYKCHITGTK